jgi:hypothetical protein
MNECGEGEYVCVEAWLLSRKKKRKKMSFFSLSREGIECYILDRRVGARKSEPSVYKNSAYK